MMQGPGLKDESFRRIAVRLCQKSGAGSLHRHPRLCMREGLLHRYTASHTKKYLPACPWPRRSRSFFYALSNIFTYSGCHTRDFTDSTQLEAKE